MLALRVEAIRKLKASDDLSAIMKVVLGNECKIAEWARLGYVALVEREEHFTEEEVVGIGVDTTAKLCELREQRYAAEWDTYINRLTLEAHGASNLIAAKIARNTRTDHLDYDHADCVTAILDAQSLGNQRLMLDAWGRMAKRTESLTMEEVERLTLPVAVMIWEVRLEMRRAAWSLIQEFGVRCDSTTLDLVQRVSSAFATELAALQDEELDYSFTGPDQGEEEDIPDSALEPPPKREKRFEESLSLWRKVKTLENDVEGAVTNTSLWASRRELRRLKLSSQRWYTACQSSRVFQYLLYSHCSSVKSTALRLLNSHSILTISFSTLPRMLMKNFGSRSPNRFYGMAADLLRMSEELYL